MNNPPPRNSASCPAYADLLVDLSDGELAEDQRQLVLAHVAECSACHAELSRLDRSLARLTAGIAVSSRPGSAGASPSRRPLRQLAAATGVALACLLVVTLAILSWPQPASAPKVAHVTQPAIPVAPPAPTITESDAFRRIALLEQQARLQTSLDLMPQDAWYDPQRAANQRLLEQMKAATSVLTSQNTPESHGEKL